MKLKNLIKEHINKDTQFFIFDSHDNKVNSNHLDVDFKKYTYNTKRYNKVKEGDLFLYRKPKKSSENNKFYFYGGGIIEKIVNIENDGYVEAIISHPFKLIKFIYEDEVAELKWTFKSKGNNWANFWNQYGMNLINYEDFMMLVGEKECISLMADNSETAITIDDNRYEEKNIDLLEEDEEINIDSRSFTLKVNEEKNDKNVNSKKNNEKINKLLSRKIDYKKLNEKNKKLGDFGEELVLKYEIEYLIENGREDLAEKVKHISKEEGDGAGFDIESYDLEGMKKLIEVKSTKKNKIDGFYISPNELLASNQYLDQYYIYRVYNIQTEKKHADLKIFRGEITNEYFKLTPTSYRVNLK